MKISAVLSIHNRSKLFRRAIDGYIWQTMPPEDWEIVLVDDMSTEDLSKTYEHLIGRINIRHVKIDHTRSPIWKEMNPTGNESAFENWYHTPAITINLGSYMARGEIVCLCHPEVLHAPWNFMNVWKKISTEPAFLFGKTWLGSAQMNPAMDRDPKWFKAGWEVFLTRMRNVDSLGSFGPTELYWYTSFLPKRAVEVVGGVDLQYLRGAAAEDDDFRDRVVLAGCQALFFPEAEGFHQDHSKETETHRNRESLHWKEGLARNRGLYYARKNNKDYPPKANAKYDWSCKETFLSCTEYIVGDNTPKVTTSPCPIS